MAAAGSDLPGWVMPFSALYRADLNRVADALQIGRDDLFIDLGCGSGGTGIWIAERTGASLVGVDFSAVATENATELAQRRGISKRANFVTADATQTGLSTGIADAVACIEVVMFSDASRVLAEISRLLKPAGRAVVIAAEAITDDAPPIVARDYRPLFADNALEIMTYDALIHYRERVLSLYHAIYDRAEALRTQMGVGADYLVGEAQKWLAREHLPPRTRDVFIVARRASS
ncbi:MAG: class I SAM-dependent methyltransferase [Candidatus Eremiobacteraeota bacterium]|nr:class I SAM-dependent methyltransferase [Candidatus Eremiobacteraeota bacterium]